MQAILSPRSAIRSRRKLRITREGWSYLFILGFIVIGSVLQQINLLVLLAGLMVAPFLLNWRVALNSIFQISVSRNLPDWTHAGNLMLIEFQIDNRRKLLPVWSVILADEIRHQELPKQQATRVECIVPQVDPGQSAYTNYRCYFGQRGIYQLGPTTVASRFPLGLVKAWYSELNQEELIVAPRLGTLTPAWRRRIASSAVGIRSSTRRRGTSQDEFFALRPWRSGDSRRAIHWRSTAKRRQLIVREFELHTDRDFALLLDLWSPEAAEATDTDQVELAISFVATVVAQLRQKIKGNIAIGLCGDTSAVYSDRVNRELARSVMQRLAALQAAAENSLATTVASIARSVSAAAPLIIVSTRAREAALADPSVSQVDAARQEIAASGWVTAGSPEFDDLFVLESPSEIAQTAKQIKPAPNEARPTAFRQLTNRLRRSTSREKPPLKSEP